MAVNIKEFIEDSLKGEDRPGTSEEKVKEFVNAALAYINKGEIKIQLYKARLVNQAFFAYYGINFVLPAQIKSIMLDRSVDKEEPRELNISALYHSTRSLELPQKAPTRNKQGARFASWGVGAKTKEQAKEYAKNLKGLMPKRAEQIVNPRNPIDSFNTFYEYYRSEKSEIDDKTISVATLLAVDNTKDPDFKRSPPEKEDKKEEPTARVESDVAKYDIKSGKPKTDFIKSFQTEALARFYNNVKDKKLEPIIKDYRDGKFLSDGMYGYRTHHISRQAINFLLAEVLKAEKAKKGGLNYKNARSLLRSLKVSFDGIHNQNMRPNKRTMIRATLIARLDNLLRLLQFKDGKVTNLDKIGGGIGKATPDTPKKKDDDTKKKPVVTPPVARKPAPKPREASCWYAQNITFGGEQATSPNTLWARTEGVETFDDWYKKMRTVLNDTRAGDSYTFLTGARTTYRAQISTMGARRSTNINIQCFITIGNALMRVLSALGNTAEMNYSKSPEALETQAAQFLNNGKYEGSLAYECQVTLYKVVMNAMRNISPKILRAASKLKQGGKNKAASDVASLVGDKAAQKIVSMRGPASVKEGLISEIILIKVDK
jgi:hypothetical protein